jgi:hypothetical protein
MQEPTADLRERACLRFLRRGVCCHCELLHFGFVLRFPKLSIPLLHVALVMRETPVKGNARSSPRRFAAADSWFSRRVMWPSSSLCDEGFFIAQ